MNSEIPHRICNISGPSPILKDAITLRGDLGVFEIFYGAPINHGFQWGTVNNISYTREDGYPSEEAKQSVRKKVVRFTKSLGMNGEMAVLAQAIPGETKIIDINDFSVLEDHGIQGYFTPEGNAFFTTIPGIPLYSLIFDCTQTVFLGERVGLSPVVGLFHSGRREADAKFPYKAIKHAIEKYGIHPKRMKLGISPSLEPEHHEIKAEDYHRIISDPLSWEPFVFQSSNGLYYLDVRSYVAHQYIEAGVPPENIELCLNGTYGSSDERDGSAVTSYRRSKQQGKRLSCPGIAVELKMS